MPARRAANRRQANLALLLGAVTIGCSPFTRLPTLDSPGNTATQRFDAIYHDPYPLDDLGPPIVGGRPRGFQVPPPDVVRSRILRGAQTTVPRPLTTVVPPP